ncbi:MAG: hypothetical protein K0S51_2128 [Bacillales bacterium]|jgi:uncharacterized membrane protein YcaP (DUF421 family)|nr:hypothetical protein [Bacillales bacterium]
MDWDLLWKAGIVVLGGTILLRISGRKSISQNEKILKKLRLTVDLLEVRLRQNSISSIEDIQYATLEPNGQLGYILKPEKQPATKQEFNELLYEMQQLKGYFMSNSISSNKKDIKPQNNNFEEIIHNKHAVEPPKQLQ